MGIGQLLGCVVLFASVGALGACKETKAKEESSSDETNEHAKRHSAKSASAKASAAPSASASAPTAATLDALFDGPPAAGSKLSTLHLGIPNGWESGEFGDVMTASKDGYSAVYDLPVYPPAIDHVTLRAQSLGCKDATLATPIDGHIGASHTPAKIYKGNCTFGGAPSTIWAVALTSKSDGPKVIVMAVKKDSLPKLEADVPTIVRGFAP